MAVYLWVQEEKEAVERARKAEEDRERQRQQQRLSFLLNQTELYSHFMAHKMGIGGAGPDAPSAPPSEAGTDGGDLVSDLNPRSLLRFLRFTDCTYHS